MRQILGWLLRWGKDEQGRRRPGMWQQAQSGQIYYALDPRADELHFDDMCVGLSREGRYCNQAGDDHPYSVAEHSVLVSVVAEDMAIARGWGADAVRLAAQYGLLHDASEAFIGDVARPIKRQRIMRGYCKAEEKFMKVLLDKYGVRPTPQVLELVHEVDNRIVLDEVEALMMDPDMWARMNRYPGLKPLDIHIECLPWKQAANVYSARFRELFPEWIQENVT